MADDSVTVSVTSKNLKQNKSKVTRLDDFSLHGWVFDLSLFSFLIQEPFYEHQGEQGGADKAAPPEVNP